MARIEECVQDDEGTAMCGLSLAPSPWSWDQQQVAQGFVLGYRIAVKNCCRPLLILWTIDVVKQDKKIE